MNPFDTLRQLAVEFRHLQAEHERKQRKSGTRRRQEGRLKEIETMFGETLARWVSTPSERERWEAHLHHGGPCPDTSLREPPLFTGRSKVDSLVELRTRGDGEADVIVDGKPVDRLPGGSELSSTMRVANTWFSETFDAPRSALDALLAYLNDPSRKPPWEHAGALFEAGLIDEHFALTARGQRFDRRERSGPARAQA